MKFAHPHLPLFALTACLLSTGFQVAAGSSDKAARALLAEMTLDEKIGQMTQVDMNAAKDRADIQKYFIGSVLSGGDSDPADISAEGWLASCREFQSHALRTRLKIPIIYGIDAVHGHNNVDGAVVMPHNVGLGATRNPRLVEKAARVTAREVAATGMHWAFAPCVATTRNLRWGRSYESFGEVPELVGRLGAAATRGLQDRLPGGARVIAGAKHYAGDGGTRDGIDQGDTVCDETTFRRLHLAPYREAVAAGTKSIMVSYNSWNGQKLHGHKYLLTDVLKGELGFKGFLVSDWAAIDQLSPDYKTAIEQSINAGLDMAMIPNGPGQKNSYVDFIRLLKELVAEKRVAHSRIDDAAFRIVRAKYEMGIFDHPYGAPGLVDQVGSPAHRKVARDCVRQSLVLLKNEGGALPFTRKVKRLAVVGNGADDLGMQCGGWTIAWQGKPGPVTKGGTTILAALKQLAPEGTQIVHTPDGANLAGADAILVVIGEQPYAEMKGDRSSLLLSAEDLALVRAAANTGVPVVTVLISGRPLVLGEALDKSAAVVAAWLPGTEGSGVADVLLGKSKPKGKLPRAWPRTDAQATASAGDPAWQDPLFPCGYGLSW